MSTLLPGCPLRHCHPVLLVPQPSPSKYSSPGFCRTVTDLTQGTRYEGQVPGSSGLPKSRVLRYLAVLRTLRYTTRLLGYYRPFHHPFHPSITQLRPLSPPFTRTPPSFLSPLYILTPVPISLSPSPSHPSQPVPSFLTPRDSSCPTLFLLLSPPRNLFLFSNLRIRRITTKFPVLDSARYFPSIVVDNTGFRFSSLLSSASARYCRIRLSPLYNSPPAPITGRLRFRCTALSKNPTNRVDLIASAARHLEHLQVTPSFSNSYTFLRSPPSR